MEANNYHVNNRTYAGPVVTWTRLSRYVKYMTVLSLAYVIYDNDVFYIFDRMLIPEETTLIWTGAAAPDELWNRPGVTLPRSQCHKQDMEQKNQHVQ